MLIQIDTREKERAIGSIIKEFDKRGIKYIVSKSYFADYFSWDNPYYTIDRKQNIREIASNCTSDHERVEAEMQKALDVGGRITFLITQDTIDGKPIESLEDVILWQPKDGQGTVRGETVYRKLRRWLRLYPIDIQFCNKAKAGQRIVELLEANNEG